MCGIAGFLGNYPKSWLENANNIQSHRGPDDSGIWILDYVGLAHTRLAIQDTSTLGRQPMSSLDNRLKIIFNGEIYNFIEIRNQLINEGYKFKSKSDTEVLLTIWEKMGEECLSILNGIFSFAIWDQLSEELYIVRDSCGVKPLFWLESSKGIAFASEAKTLFSLLPKDIQINSDNLLKQMTYLWCPGPSTLVPNINSLSPGHLMKINKNNKFLIKSWKEKLPYKISFVRHKREAINRTSDLLRQAVHRQMISDVPLGAFLSGGLDSSSIVTFAREINPNIECFTINNLYDGSEGFTDDLPYARKVASHLGVNLHEITVENDDLCNDIKWLLSRIDFPVADPAPLNVFQISKSAKKLGIKVLLSGTGGDDIFSGYRRHVAVELDKYWQWWPRPIKEVLSKFSNSVNKKNNYIRRIAKYFQYADKNPEERLINYFRWGKPSLIRSLLSDYLKEKLEDKNALNPMQSWLKNLPDNFTNLQKILTLEQRYFLCDHNLYYTDIMSMEEGVEVRVPFLDKDLINWSLRLPDKFKQRGLTSKWVLKKSMEKYLSKDIIYRPKSGFGAPLSRWLKKDLKELMRYYLDHSNLKKQNLFNPESVKSLVDKNDNGTIDGTYLIYSILCISIWFEQKQWKQ